MTGYIALIVVLLLFVAAGVAVALDLTPDTRDPEYGVGPMLHPRSFGTSTRSDR
jgi:hypothetical protein